MNEWNRDIFSVSELKEKQEWKLAIITKLNLLEKQKYHSLDLEAKIWNEINQ